MKGQSKEIKTTSVYSLTSRGTEITQLVLRLKKSFPELWEFDSFKNVDLIE